MNVSAKSTTPIPPTNQPPNYQTQDPTTIESLPSVCVSKIIGEAIVKQIDQLLFGPPTDASHRRRTITDAIASVKQRMNQIINGLGPASIGVTVQDYSPIISLYLITKYNDMQTTINQHLIGTDFTISQRIYPEAIDSLSLSEQIERVVKMKSLHDLMEQSHQDLPTNLTSDLSDNEISNILTPLSMSCLTTLLSLENRTFPNLHKSLPSVSLSKIIGEEIVKDIDQFLFGPLTAASHQRQPITNAIASVNSRISLIPYRFLGPIATIGVTKQDYIPIISQYLITKYSTIKTAINEYLRDTDFTISQRIFPEAIDSLLLEEQIERVIQMKSLHDLMEQSHQQGGAVCISLCHSHAELFDPSLVE